MSFTKDYLRIKRWCVFYTVFEVAFLLAAVFCLFKGNITLFIADLAMVGVNRLEKTLCKLILIIKYKEDK